MNDQGPKNPLTEHERKVQELHNDSQVQASIRSLSAGSTPPPQTAASGSTNATRAPEIVTKESLRRIHAMNLQPQESRDHLSGFAIKLGEAEPNRSIAKVPATLANPAAALQPLLRENACPQHEIQRAEIAAFATCFRQEHSFDLLFADDAVAALIDASLAEDKTIRALCAERFRDFHHGLKLIARNTGRTQFPITRDVVTEPDKVLSIWVVESFRIARASQGLA